MPEAVRARMEAAFGADFSSVTVREGEEPAAADALALTRGEAITLRPGLGATESPDGMRVLAHELAHVVQQRAGRVAGAGLTEDPALEAEADEAGERAASGQQVAVASGAVSGGAPAETATQPVGPLSRLKRAIATRFGRSAAPQQAPEPEPERERRSSADLSELRAPTEALERLRLRAIAQGDAYVHAPDDQSRQAAKDAYDRTMEAIHDEMEGTPGQYRRDARRRARLFAPLIARDAERARTERLFQPDESGQAEYFRTPGFGRFVHAPGTDPPYIQTPGPPPYGLSPKLRRSGE